MTLKHAHKTPPGEAPAPKTTTTTPTLAASRQHVKPRRRPALIAAAIALILVAGLAALGVVSSMQTQNRVLSVSHDLHRGDTISATDLTTTTVGALTGVSSVPASQLQSLVGKHALTDLKGGTLLPQGTIGDASLPDDAHSILGLSLAPGRLPSGTMTPGSRLRLVILPPAQGSDTTTGQIYDATLVSTSNATVQGTGTMVNVQVEADKAATIATMAAANRVALIKDADR